MSKKVIFDTDPGVDDTMALLFAELSKDIDLIGITTVVGNTYIEGVTRNALYVKERFNIKAPVHQGAGRPLFIEPEEPPHFVHGDNGLGNIDITPPSITAGAESAAEFIVNTIMANPGEITLIAVGRMTNLALALRLCPDIAIHVKEVIVMGGALGKNGNTGNISPVAEANIGGDPHAADMVFTAPWPVTLVGLDVTMQTRMDEQYMEIIRDEGGSTGQFIYDISRFYMNFHKETTGHQSFFVHDSSAIAYAIQPELFEVQKGALRVVTEGIAAGQTIMAPADKKFPPSPWDNMPVQQACISVDSKGLLELYRQTICQ